MQDHTISTRHLEPPRSRPRPSIRSGLKPPLHFRHQLPALALCAVLAAALLLSAMSQFLFFRELALTSLILGLTCVIQSTQGARLQISRKIPHDTVSSKK